MKFGDILENDSYQSYYIWATLAFPNHIPMTLEEWVAKGQKEATEND